MSNNSTINTPNVVAISGIKSRTTGTFSLSEAAKCMIANLSSVKEDSVHKYWKVEVLDEDYNSYQWEDWETPGDANEVTLKTNIKGHLLDFIDKLEYKDKTTTVTEVTTTESNNCIGDIIGTP